VKPTEIGIDNPTALKGLNINQTTGSTLSGLMMYLNSSSVGFTYGYYESVPSGLF